MSQRMQLVEIIHEIVRIGTSYPEYAVGSLVPFLPLIIGFITWKFSTKSSRTIFWFTVFFILTDIPTWVTTALDINNLLYNDTKIFAVNIFLLALYFIGLKRKSDKKILTGYLGIMVLGLILQLFGVIEKGKHNWINVLLLGSVAVWYFVRLIDYPKIRDLLSYPFFWFNTGILFYCFSTLLIYFFFQFSITPDIKGPTYFLFRSILEYLTSVMFVLFAIGFLNLKKNSQVTSK
jgi:cell division protein FtsW (lipid II flippase)